MAIRYHYELPLKKFRNANEIELFFHLFFRIESYRKILKEKGLKLSLIRRPSIVVQCSLTSVLGRVASQRMVASLEKSARNKRENCKFCNLKRISQQT